MAYQLLAIDYSKLVLRISSSRSLRGDLVKVCSTHKMDNPRTLAYLLLVPIVAIFTKYDKLVDHIRIYENFAGRNEKAVINAKLDELCVRPFREQIGGMTKIPTIEVSSEYNN